MLVYMPGDLYGYTSRRHLFFTGEKKTYKLLKKYCNYDNKAYSNCLKINKNSKFYLNNEFMAIKEGIRDNKSLIEFLDCAIYCCSFHACNHIFVFTDNQSYKENLPCFCVKCGLSLSYTLYDAPGGGRKSSSYAPSVYYLSNLGINKDNIWKYIEHYNFLGYLPVSTYLVKNRYNRVIKDHPKATDEEITRMIINIITEEKHLTR